MGDPLRVLLEEDLVGERPLGLGERRGVAVAQALGPLVPGDAGAGVLDRAEERVVGELCAVEVDEAAERGGAGRVRRELHAVEARERGAKGPPLELAHGAVIDRRAAPGAL